MPPAGKALEDYTWEEISAISKAGKAAEYFAVGDTKSILFNGVTYYQQIIGFNHDDVTDLAAYGRDKAGVTFQFGIPGMGNAGVFATAYPMDGSNLKSGGWKSSALRRTTMPLMESYLPTDLRDIIVAVNKPGNDGSSDGGVAHVQITSDFLWPLSEIEILGARKYSGQGEGAQYEFYADGGSLIRYRASTAATAYGWWTRSPTVDSTVAFVRIASTGNVAGLSPAESSGVSFGFCV